MGIIDFLGDIFGALHDFAEKEVDRQDKFKDKVDFRLERLSDEEKLNLKKRIYAKHQTKSRLTEEEIYTYGQLKTMV